MWRAHLCVPRPDSSGRLLPSTPQVPARVPARRTESGRGRPELRVSPEQSYLHSTGGDVAHGDAAAPWWSIAGSSRVGTDTWPAGELLASALQTSPRVARAGQRAIQSHGRL